MAITSIHLNRIILALLLTFLVADTYPHPELGPGLVASTLHQVQQILVANF